MKTNGAMCAMGACLTRPSRLGRGYRELLHDRSAVLSPEHRPYRRRTPGSARRGTCFGILVDRTALLSTLDVTQFASAPWCSCCSRSIGRARARWGGRACSCWCSLIVWLTPQIVAVVLSIAFVARDPRPGTCTFGMRTASTHRSWANLSSSPS